MRTTRRAWGTWVGAVALAVLASGDRAGAGDERSAGAWVFDVRVVRVFSAVAGNAEQAPPWSAEPSTVSTPWAEVLASLKARGDALVLLDRRVTTVTNVLAEVVDSQTFSLQRFERGDNNNESRVSSQVEAGVSARLTPSDALQYQIDVKWLVEPQLGASGSTFTGLAKWSGAHPRFDGKTLVLSHRQQIARAPVEGAPVPPLTVEIYALVTGRFVP